MHIPKDVNETANKLADSLSDEQCHMISILMEADRPMSGADARYAILRLLYMQAVVCNDYLHRADDWYEDYCQVYTDAMSGRVK